MRFEIPYADIEGHPRAKGASPATRDGCCWARSATYRVVVFSGRVHRYQGVSSLDAAYPARLAAALGAETLIVTNAAGGVNPELEPGDALLISDHINLTADSPLVGWPGPAGRYAVRVHERRLRSRAVGRLLARWRRSKACACAKACTPACSGPRSRHPPRCAICTTIGADVVGMSTVPEVIAARALGLRVLGLSLVTNVAAGHGLGHDEVLEACRVGRSRPHASAAWYTLSAFLSSNPIACDRSAHSVPRHSSDSNDCRS